ncbi:hypothetical protein [Parapedobacter sp.]
MKMTTKTLFLSIVSYTLFACNQASPKKVVDVVWLNVNRVTANYSPQFFGELRELRASGGMAVAQNNEKIKGTAVAYVNQYVIGPLDESMDKIEKLPENEETKALIAASLEVFNYGKGIFENEYLSIAKMIDAESPASEIDAAVEKLFATHDEHMHGRLADLDELVIPYAEKHGVPIQLVNNRPN